MCSEDASAPHPSPSRRAAFTALVAVIAVLAAMGLTAAESAFGSADGAVNAAIQAAGGEPGIADPGL